MSERSLVVRQVTRHHSGRYACSGTNSRGEGVSNAVPLTVRYSPQCRQRPAHMVQHIRGAERSHFLNLTCPVESLPLPTKYR